MKSIRILVAALGLIVVCALAGVVLPRPVWRVHNDAPAGHQILVLSNPIHTDIAIPVDDELKSRFAFLPGDGLDFNLDGVRYLIFGWGGRAFYTQTPTWADLKAVPVLKSLTLDRSVMHVELAGDIPAASPYATAIHLDEDGYGRLIGAIRQSFSGQSGAPIHIEGYDYGPYDTFFEAGGYFNVLAGCNTWTAAMLRQAGVSTGWWTPLPWMLRLALRLHNGVEIVAR